MKRIFFLFLILFSSSTFASFYVDGRSFDTLNEACNFSAAGNACATQGISGVYKNGGTLVCERDGGAWCGSATGSCTSPATLNMSTGECDCPEGQTYQNGQCVTPQCPAGSDVPPGQSVSEDLSNCQDTTCPAGMQGNWVISTTTFWSCSEPDGTQQNCENLGGVWDPVEQSCDLTGVTPSDSNPNEPPDCNDGGYVLAEDGDKAGQYVCVNSDPNGDCRDGESKGTASYTNAHGVTVEVSGCYKPFGSESGGCVTNETQSKMQCAFTPDNEPGKGGQNEPPKSDGTCNSGYMVGTSGNCTFDSNSDATKGGLGQPPKSDGTCSDGLINYFNVCKPDFNDACGAENQPPCGGDYKTCEGSLKNILGVCTKDPNTDKEDPDPNSPDYTDVLTGIKTNTGQTVDAVTKLRTDNNKNFTSVISSLKELNTSVKSLPGGGGSDAPSVPGTCDGENNTLCQDTKDIRNGLLDNEGVQIPESLTGAPEFSVSSDRLFSGFKSAPVIAPFVAMSTSKTVNSTCPTASFSAFGTSYVVDAHCGIAADYRGLIRSIFIAVWTIVCIRLFLEA